MTTFSSTTTTTGNHYKPRSSSLPPPLMMASLSLESKQPSPSLRLLSPTVTTKSPLSTHAVFSTIIFLALATIIPRPQTTTLKQHRLQWRWSSFSIVTIVDDEGGSLGYSSPNSSFSSHISSLLSPSTISSR
ncbi:hypothetical protein VNO77_26925 [Canavalia gladiata]|uniref:Uncharacterized protein n=1 Tax=Canavalia gladiata TaxID=3824 RepID=A0AAN9KW01_CANGL